MTLVDSGPLVALLNRNDAHHARCSAALRALPAGGLMTTSPCVTEAMYMLGRGGGWRAQESLWALFGQGLVRVHGPAEGEWERMRTLMRDYSDAPMDFADASLVAASETLNQRRIFTVDGHFHAYRQRQGHAFEVVP